MKPKIAKWLYKERAKQNPQSHSAMRCRLYDHLLTSKSQAKLCFDVDFFRGAS
jgi:hypothetical protein